MSRSSTNVGKYQLLEEIGRGGMGAVYKSHDPFLDRTVAIKLLAPHLVWEKTFVERFLREARAAARLHHPNIIDIYDVGYDGHDYYFVMAYLPGPSLKQAITWKGHLAPDEALPILRQLANALDYAHSEGLIHRDVKPANVMFDKRGQAILTDFGIVKAAQETKLTATGAVIGTPQYMSPEQVQGKAVDASTDQYALGIIAYEMLAGRVPFDSDTVTTILHMQVYDSPPSILALRPELPRAVEDALKRVLSKSLDERYASCGEFVEALHHALAQPAAEAQPPLAFQSDTSKPINDKRDHDTQAVRLPQRYPTELVTPAPPVQLKRGLSRKMITLLLAGAGILVLALMVLGNAVLTGQVSVAILHQPPTPTCTPIPLASPPNKPGLAGGDFTVTFPGTPKDEKQTLNTPGGPIDLYTRSFQDSSSAYFVNYMDLPESSIQRADLEQFLDDMADSAAKAVHGNPLKKQSISLDGYPGVEVAFEMPESTVPGGSTGKARVYLVKSRVYQVIVVNKSGIPSDNLDRFLDSFRLLGEIVSASTPAPLPVVALSASNASQMTQLARWGKGTINRVAWSPDGKQFAIASSLGVYFYNGQTMQQTRFIDTGMWISSVAFSPDGGLLALGTADKTVKIWEVSTGRELYNLSGHGDYVKSVAFSPDGKFLASGSWDKTVKLWEVSSGREVRALAGHTDKVSSIAFSPDGKLLASGSEDKTVRIWDLESGSEMHTLVGYADWVTSVAFSPNGKLLASSSTDTTVKVWEVSSWRELRTLTGHTSPVWNVAFSSDSNILASGDGPVATTIRLWNVTTGLEVRTLTGHTSDVSSVAFLPDGMQLASGATDGTVRVWEVSSGRELRTLSGHTSLITSVAFSPDGKVMASGTWDGKVRLWEVPNGRELNTLYKQNYWVRSVAFSPDGKVLASAPFGWMVNLWDVSTGRELRTISGLTSYASSVAFSPDGKMLAVGANDGIVKVLDVSSGRELHTLSGHTAVVTHVAFSPDGKLLASGSGDKTVRVWEVASGHEVFVITGHTDYVSDIAFSPDGRKLASGSYDKTVKVWDVTTGRELRTLSSHTDKVECVAFSPDGKILASGSWDKTVKIWEVSTWREMRTLTGHTYFVRSVAFSQDGKLLASGSQDGTVRLWGVR